MKFCVKGQDSGLQSVGTPIPRLARLLGAGDYPTGSSACRPNQPTDDRWSGMRVLVLGPMCHKEPHAEPGWATQGCGRTNTPGVACAAEHVRGGCRYRRRATRRLCRREADAETLSWPCLPCPHDRGATPPALDRRRATDALARRASGSLESALQERRARRLG